MFNIDTYQHLQLTYLIADGNDEYGYLITYCKFKALLQNPQLKQHKIPNLDQTKSFYTRTIVLCNSIKPLQFKIVQFQS